MSGSHKTALRPRCSISGNVIGHRRGKSSDPGSLGGGKGEASSRAVVHIHIVQLDPVSGGLRIGELEDIVVNFDTPSMLIDTPDWPVMPMRFSSLN